MSQNPKATASNQILIAPSILSADFAFLSKEISAVESAGADWLHLDVMDGMFVPNITIGPAVVQAVRKVTRLHLDVHLMICDPDRYVDQFAAAGADTITIHAEADKHIQRTLHRIRALGKRAGIALNPHTSEDVLRYLLDDLDQVLVMTVNPGFGGQAFLSQMVGKVRAVRQLLIERACSALVEVDGGISPVNCAQVIGAGAQVLVAGSAVFSQPDYAYVIQQLRAMSGHDKS